MLVNEIATLATKLHKKTNRKEAYDIVRSAIENDGVLDQYALANLYSFFIPNTPKVKTDFQWVHTAISTEATRYYLNYVYVADGEMVATDGHRLHLAKTELENGFYDKAGNKVEVDATFPDYHRVIPEPAKPYSWVAAHCEVREIGDNGLAYILTNGAGVNKKYWDIASQGADVVDFDMADEATPLRMDFENGRLAVVMPMRV